jgi:tRNA (uracil-5-)-methyltransferase
LDEGQASSSSTVIRDEPFDVGYIVYDPSRYEEFLAEKTTMVVSNLTSKGISLPEVETFPSPPKFFRLRCRLGTHVRFSAAPVLDPGATETVDKVTFLQWDQQGVPSIEVEVFPIASSTINQILRLMKTVLEGRGGEAVTLCRYLSSIHVLSSLQGQAVLTLVYDKEKQLEESETELRAAAAWFINAIKSERPDVSIIAQSKGVRFVEPRGKDYVMETLDVKIPDSSAPARLFYKQPVDGFSNPNGKVNEACLGWLCSVAYSNCNSSEGDLLEMYSGCSNHTVGIAKYFRSVVCVELNKALCEAAKFNLSLNDITNVKVVAGPSEKFAKAILRKGSYKDTNREYSFNSVLVDPPRGGLDADTRFLLKTGNFRSIIYISCNPDSLVRDLNIICSDGTYRVERFAVCDHFAYSKGHLESLVLLVKI